jgi:type VI secretion system secreted protein VgrG
VSLLTPGVYSFSSSAQLTGALTLNFAGASNEEFVFQIGTQLTTASASDIIVENGNSTDSVYFKVGSSAVLGTTTDFAGTIIAGDSITLDTGAEILCGRAIALTGQVAMQGNTISSDCSATSGGSGGTGSGGTGTAAVPEPASLALLGMGIAGLGLGAIRRRRKA